MGKESLNAVDFQAMIHTAAGVLRSHRSTVDALNVFPVPDGDTGTNMSLTLASASAEVKKAPADSLDEVSHKAALGSLMGARGNSGVILSQIFRGISQGFSGKHTASPLDLGRALEEGVRTAYRAVMKPVEGTILTVAKESARAAMESARMGGDVLRVWQAACDAAEVALARTPDLLPVLKQAGVVDAGGKGLVYFLSAGMDSLMGQSHLEPEDAEIKARFKAVDADSALVYPYDVQLLVHGMSLPVATMRRKLRDLGDSLLVVSGQDVTRVHIHTDEPGRVLEVCLGFGDISGVEIDNMRRQYQEVSGVAPAEVPLPGNPRDSDKEVGVVAVAVGGGFIEVFKSLGANEVIDGGQTMNPSTEEVAKAVEQCSCDKVIVLPNNPNVILGAQQAGRLTGKEVHVLPTRSLPQGVAALLALRYDREVGTNLAHMEKAFHSVKTGEITYAVRDTVSESLRIKTGDILGISDGRILSAGKDPSEVLVDLLKLLIENGDELLSVFYGDMVDSEAAEGLARRLEAVFPGFEVEMRYGGQPLHYYIFSIE